MKFAVFLILASAVSAFPKHFNVHPGRGFLSSLISDAFGDDDTTTSTVKATAKSSAVVGSPVTATSSSTLVTKTKGTLIPPATATATASPTQSTSSITSSSSADTSSITSTSSSASSSTSTSTPTPVSTSSTPAPTPSTDPSAQPSQSNNNNGGGVSGAGVAVAVILVLVVLGCLIWALFRYHPGVRAWWLAREEKRRQERSYRDGIDGPLAGSRGSGARDQALGPSRKSMLQSFFAPKTVILGDGKEIRRKPVNWGAKPDGNSPEGMEKVALTEMAAPMARTGTTKSGISAITAMERSESTRSNLSAVSALTTHPGRQKELPPMPPMPPMPPEPVRTKGPDVHKILSRKSIYELA